MLGGRTHLLHRQHKRLFGNPDILDASASNGEVRIGFADVVPHLASLLNRTVAECKES